MGLSLQQVLSPLVILKTISKIAMPGTSLSKHFGWNVGNGPIPGAMLNIGGEKEGQNVSHAGNVEDCDTREFSYDIFNNTRKVGSARAPGQESVMIAPQVVGNVRGTIPRMAESMHMPYEKIHNQRPIGGPTSGIDAGGARYIEKQKNYQIGRMANAIEFQTAAMLRGSWYYIPDTAGNLIYQSFTDPGGDGIEINYQLPAGNQSQLDVFGDGDIISADWSTSSTDIPGHLYAINDAMTQKTGQGLRHVHTTSAIWNYVINNDKVKAQAGTARRPFERLSKESPGEFSCVLHGIPWVMWHIVDYGLEVWDPNSSAETYQKVIEANHAVFTPEVNNTWCYYMRGGEWMVEGPNGSKSFQHGLYSYGYEVHDPAGAKLTTIHNGFPALPVPEAIMNAEVVGF